MIRLFIIYYHSLTSLHSAKPASRADGKMVLTMDRARKPEQAATLQPDGTKWDVFRNFKSGMVSGWNKWCYTGGYAVSRAPPLPRPRRRCISKKKGGVSK